jgi:hypothetical protein
MESALKSRLQSVRFGEVQAYKNLAIVPLLSPKEGKLKYLTLNEALASWNIAVTEISAGGSISELRVVNRGNQPVLLIEGEELAGAKQNRVPNTSILLKESSKTRIPVSSTEQGRWFYASRAFRESGNVMARTTRARKVRSVSASLAQSVSFFSDQREVWDGIAELQSKACVPSPTSAMSDLFKAREDDLHECAQSFPLLFNQIGLLVVIDGQAVGLDLVSYSSAYAKLHPKLIHSYALESLLEPEGHPITPAQALDRTCAFFEDIQAARSTPFPSVGYGTDLRFQAERLVGTALVYDNEVIHSAFFSLDDQDKPAKTGARRRRRDQETQGSLTVTSPDTHRYHTGDNIWAPRGHPTSGRTR